MRSFATIPGKRFVIPRSSRTGGGGHPARFYGGRPIRRRRQKARGGRLAAPPRQNPALDELRASPDGLILPLMITASDAFILRSKPAAVALRADLADVLATVLQVEDEVGAGLQLAGLRLLEEV